MKKDKKNKSQEGKVQEGKAQKGREVKKDLPIRNPTTDSAKNTDSQSPGLNQARTTRDDLFPSDGDNLTS